MIPQLRVYKNKQHFANIPTAVLRNGATGVPYEAIREMIEFVAGKTATTRYREWSWEWQWMP